MGELLDRFFEKLEFWNKKNIFTTFSRFHKGSSIKDVCTNLGTFGTPLLLSRSVHIWLTTPYPLPTVRVSTMLALFETLQLVDNSHWRVKKLIILFENSIKNIRVKTIFEMMSLHCIPYSPYWIQAEWKF